MSIIRPKNWHDFQHYKNRAPIWIKLHRRLLDDYEFHCLPLASRALAPMLWLLASEYENGDIPGDTRAIAFRLHITLQELSDAFQPLVDAGFFEVVGADASKTLASGKHVAMPEKRREQVTSNKTETEKKKRAPPRAGFDEVPDWVPSQAWHSFVDMRRALRAPLTGHGARLAVEKLLKLRDEGHDPTAVLEQSTMHSWKGLFEVKHDHRGGTQQQGRGVRDGAEHALATLRRDAQDGEGNHTRAEQHQALAKDSSSSGNNPGDPSTNHQSPSGSGRDFPRLGPINGGAELAIPDILQRPKPPLRTAIVESLQALSDGLGEQIFPNPRAIAGAR